MLRRVNRPFLRNRHRLAPLALLGALTLGSACNGKEQPAKQDDPKPADSKDKPGDPKAPLPSGPVANPSDSPAIAEVGEVIATVQLPSGTKMTDIAAVIDSVQPGASAMLKMQLPAALEDAAGFDIAASAKLDAPLSFVILNPASHPKPLALLVEAKDAAKLAADAKGAGHAVEQRDNLLLIGPEDVVSAAKDFAFANLTKYPDHSEIIIYPKLLLGSFAGEIEKNMGASMALLGNEGLAQVMTNYAKGLISLGEQTERIVLSLASGSGSADLIARIYPVGGSSLASFVAAQVPSQHGLLGKLPDADGTMVMTGDMRAGDARDALLNFGVAVLAPMYSNVSVDEWMAMLEPWVENLDGSFALSMTMTITPGQPGAMQFQSLMGANDPEALRNSWRTMLTKMAATGGLEMMGMKFTSSHKPDVLTHDGVAIDLYESKIDTSALTAEQAAAIEAASAATSQSMHFATFDKLAAMASADADGAAIKSLIDGARGKGFEPNGQFATVLDASKQRGDSMLMYFDLASLMAANPTPVPLPFKAMSWGIGKHEGALSMRISLIK